MEENEMSLIDCLAFLASCIRCGTQWDDRIERTYQMALNMARIKEETSSDPA